MCVCLQQCKDWYYSKCTLSLGSDQTSWNLNVLGDPSAVIMENKTQVGFYSEHETRTSKKTPSLRNQVTISLPNLSTEEQQERLLVDLGDIIGILVLRDFFRSIRDCLLTWFRTCRAAPWACLSASPALGWRRRLWRWRAGSREGEVRGRPAESGAEESKLFFVYIDQAVAH